MKKLRNGVQDRSRRAVANASPRVPKYKPQRGTMASDTPEPGIGEVLFSYAEERKTKPETVAPPLRFRPEAKDIERLLPRLREAGRR